MFKPSPTPNPELLFVSEADNGEILVEALPDSFRRSPDGVWRKGSASAVELMEKFSRVEDSARAASLFQSALTFSKGA